jgi:valyl-tRNA synthetase
MPFITEELWVAMGERPYELIVAKWPDPVAQVDAQAKAELDWLLRLVSEVRSARTELNVPPGARLPFDPRDANEITVRRLETYADTLSKLARIERSVAIGGAAFGPRPGRFPRSDQSHPDQDRPLFWPAPEKLRSNQPSTLNMLSDPANSERYSRKRI